MLHCPLVHALTLTLATAGDQAAAQRGHRTGVPAGTGLRGKSGGATAEGGQDEHPAQLHADQVRPPTEECLNRAKTGAMAQEKAVHYRAISCLLMLTHSLMHLFRCL